VGIDLRFLTSGAAKINWDSLKILYGAFKLDITDRVKKEAKVLPDGIQIASANLPIGSHKLVIQVATPRASRPSGKFGLRWSSLFDEVRFRMSNLGLYFVRGSLRR
jgi:hypothetical protein